MHKRRRLSQHKWDTMVATENALAAIPKVVVATVPGANVCVSCSRALTTRHSCLLLCSKCGSSTCFVCSRRCTGPGSSSQTLTPSRSVLALNSPNTNLVAEHGTPNSAVSNKRKKAAEGDDDGANKVSRREKPDEAEEETEDLSGCGKVFCQNCCVESVQSDSTACLDCLSRPRNAMI
ncbi:hypothetical protein CPB85DRAFT_1428074 [Mucidula mucida]|nr:hypothetical protein CPB85DRAFT_1428074 [Mucidula mucida]